MAGFSTKTFKIHDDYYTPFSAWDNVKKYIPTDKIIWEAFYGDGKSGTHLQKLGYNTIHKNIDFFESDEGDIIVSNPPFSKKEEVFTRLKELNKPFMIICPCSMLTTQYFRKLFSNEKIQIIIPRRRIQFIKNGDENCEKKCNFDCFYYCWKMNLPQDIVYLDNDISMKKSIPNDPPGSCCKIEQEEITKLKEENKKLKEQLKNFSHKRYYVVNQKLQEEIKQLKEQLQKQ